VCALIHVNRVVSISQDFKYGTALHVQLTDLFWEGLGIAEIASYIVSSLIASSTVTLTYSKCLRMD